MHRRPLRPGSRPRFCSDRRALLLIRAWHLPRRPGIGRALQRHPFSGLVDSAGMLTLEPFTEDQGRSAVQPAKGSRQSASLRLTGLLAVDSHTCQTPWSVFQDGPNGEPAGDARSAQVPKHARQRALPSTIATTTSPQAYQLPGLGPPP
ncbi:Protein TAR1 [Senna tora]|uniref:Protein TAR1 n=1 Tax=Senna tora TaxID=362788 RepID=A0A834VXG8_9FABA|nr:Protein TAR1 [Senna tora]